MDEAEEARDGDDARDREPDGKAAEQGVCSGQFVRGKTTLGRASQKNP